MKSKRSATLFLLWEIYFIPLGTKKIAKILMSNTSNW